MASHFESRYHPGTDAAGLVYARRLAGPIGACTVPVMIGATASALQGQSVWAFLVWGLPFALGAASVWTQFMLSTTPAELHLRPGQCATRSIHDVLYDRPLQWNALYGVEESAAEIELAIGWTTKVCRRADWRRFEKLREAARHALQASSPLHA